MNKFYFIIPAVLLAAFIVYYSQFSKQMAEQEKAKQEEVAREKALEEQQKQEAIKKAAAEARQREEAQRAKEAAAEADRRAKWEAASRKIADDTDNFQQQADTHARQAAELEVKLDSLHSAHAQAQRELFELQKEIELARIAKRDAELEIQRTYDIVTQKVAASALASYTPPKAK